MVTNYSKNKKQQQMQLLYSRSSSHQKRHRYCCAIFIYWISQEKKYFFASPTLCLNSWISSAKSVLKKHLQVKLERLKKLFGKLHQEEPLNITQHFSTLFVLLGLLLLPLALSPHSACALFLLCKKKKNIKTRER